MKMKIQTLVALFLLIAGFAGAQPGQRPRPQADPEKMAERMTARMTEQLDLTEDQQAKIKAIHLAFAEKMKDRTERPTPEEMKALREEQQEAVNNVLTDEQKAKVEAQKAERKARMEKNIQNGIAMHDELSAYRTDNIEPVMTQQREKLEAKISTEDKAQIQALRDQIKAEWEKRKAKAQEKAKEKGFDKDQKGRGRFGARPDAPRNVWAPDPENPYPAGPHKAMGLIFQDDEARTKTKKLVETYSDDMDDLFAEIADQQEQWKKDTKAIHEKYKPEMPEFGDDRPGPGPEGDQPHKGKRSPDHPKFDGKRPGADGPRPEKRADRDMPEDRKDFMKKMAFLLRPVGEDNEVLEDVRVERLIDIYPNPAGATQSIEFEVLKAGKVTVEIVDLQGNLVRTVFTGEMASGKNKLDVNTSGLTGKRYYYRITDGSGVSSKAFHVE